MLSYAMVTRRHILPLLAAPLGLAACRGDASFQFIGDHMPDVALPMMGGATINLAHLGRMSVVRFWDMACPRCNEDELHWQNVVRAITHAKAAQCLSVHCGNTGNNDGDLRSFLAGLKPDIVIPVALDRDLSYCKALGISGVPLTLIIASDGRVLDTNWAFRTMRGERAFVAKVLRTHQHPV